MLPSYWFGVYHWRRRFRRIGIGVAVAVVGAAGGSVVATRPAFVAGLALVTGGLWYAQPALKRLLVPSPFSPQRWKYAPLAQGIDWDGTGPAVGNDATAGDPAAGDANAARGRPVDRWLDLGSGTGRSLVGLAEHVPDGCRVTAFDPFDSRVILGNGARLARRNAARAGVTVEPVRGDAGRLPIAADSHDAVTACRVLHDLSRENAERTVREVRRVLRPDGQFGVIELGATHEETDDPLDYWEGLLGDGGFTVVASGRVERGRGTYYYVICEPAD